MKKKNISLTPELLELVTKQANLFGKMELRPIESQKHQLRLMKARQKRGCTAEAIAKQYRLEKTYAKNQKFDLMLADIFSNPDFINHCILQECTDEEVMKVANAIMHTLVHKRIEPGVIAGLMQGFFDGNRQEALNFVSEAAECGFLDKGFDEVRGAYFTVPNDVLNHRCFELLPETKELIDTLAYIGPMVCPPDPATNKHGSYFHVDTGQFVLNFKGFNAEEDFCIETTNRAQQTAHALNEDMVLWVLDNYGELYQRGAKESFADWKKRKRYLERFKLNAIRYIKEYAGEPMYFCRRVCTSGRECYMAYILNPQGMAYQKACIDLYHKEFLTIKKVPWADPDFHQFSGEEYLMMAIGSAYDKYDGAVFEADMSISKLPHWEILAWFKRHEHELYDEEFICSCKRKTKPEFIALCAAWKAVKNNKPIGTVISEDGTASGPQNLGAAFNDKFEAMLTNVIPGDKGDWRYNIYTEVFQLMLKVLGQNVYVDYEDFKRAVMTAFYSSTYVPKVCLGTDGFERDPNKFSKEYKVFLQVMEICCPVIWKLNELVRKAWKDNVTRYSWMMPDGFHVEFPVKVTSQGYLELDEDKYVTSWIQEGTKKHGKSLMAILAHSLDAMDKREMERRLNWDPKVVGFVKAVLAGKVSKKYKTSQYVLDQAEKLSKLYEITKFRTWRWLNYVTPDTIDVYFDRKMVQEMVDMLSPEPISFIHIYDDFRAHPNNGNWVRAWYNEIMYDLHKSRTGMFLLLQIDPKIIKQLPTGHGFDSKLCRKSNYSLSC